MDRKSDLRNGKYSSSILLLIVLIGFCILAIIEILYGQAQIRMERERLALEEENNRAVQELKTEWNNLKGDSVGSESAEAVGEEQNSSLETEKTLINTGDTLSSNSLPVADEDDSKDQPAEDEREYAMQIVVLGDSIMAQKREIENDVPTLIGQACNAKVYNMAIGGTTAALLPDEQPNYGTWSSLGLLGMVNAILGNIEPDFFDGYEAGEILRECDFSQTDYFVIEYGINDFQCGQIPRTKYGADGVVYDIDATHTYSEALDLAVNLLHNKFPDAIIMLVAPHYCQFFDGAAYIGDAYSLNNGYGTLVEFSNCMDYVANQHKTENTIFFNAMELSGIDAYSAKEYLEDGVHLSNMGRRVYADCIAERINADFYREE